MLVSESIILKKIAIFLLLLITVISSVLGQKVALVLSGGAAKGLAHLGAIKALEEHHIPIDYVVGTSMGSVIGSCYAAGFSVDQIENILLSEEFQKWVKGEIRNEYNYYYNKEEDNASWVNIDFSIDSSLNATINSSLAEDLSINFELVEQFARESEVANYNFDSLFIPFRAVASEIFTQQTVILDSGSVGKAVRASLSVPFFYRPIKLNDQYLFDGGIYDNFPVDIAKTEFNPDVIIGVNVSSKVYEEYPYEEDDKLISQALVLMMIDKSDPSSVGESGIYIEPDLSAFSSLDFGKVKSMIDSGYHATLRQMDEIKAKIQNRDSKEKLAENRKEFLAKRKPLTFDAIKFHGYNSKQQNYIRKLFGQRSGNYTLESIKTGYYKLVSEDYFKTVYPDILYDSVSGHFNFHLYGRPRNNFGGGLGGMISTRNISHVYLGLKYYRFDKYFSKTHANFYAGNFYKSASIASKFMLPGKHRLYFGPDLRYNNWNYINTNELIFKNSTRTIVDMVDRYVGLNIGMPIGARYKLVGSAALFNHHNEFSNVNILNSRDTLDIQRIKGAKYQLSLSNNTLNRPQYASNGKAFNLKFSYYNTEEIHIPGNTSVLTESKKTSLEWIALKIKMEQYFNKGKKYTFGYSLESTISNQQDFATFIGTIINAPVFSPLSDSKTLVLQRLRAFNYVAIGYKNIFALSSNIDFRLEGYAFKALNQIVPTNAQTVEEKSFNLEDVFISATTGFVYHSPVGPIAANLNYYDDPENKFGVFIHFGYVLFNKSTFD
jgi:NTE family protein